ncbi:oligosaccharide flippase family protein [Clostridium butyricum]|uniref:oligosaccharide flippase family protein n=1 Tax=Clostridium butyricum TaxID=1492 RepID=UPI003D324CE1
MGNFKRNLIFAIIAQGTSTLLSILITIILPKMMGVEQFAYWQLFIFYSSYVGFFHFGLSDGLYLKYGGTNIENMDKSLIGSQFRLMVIWQIVISIFVLLFIPFFIGNSERIFVWILTAIYLVVANATWCLGYIFQAANETKIYSVGTIISKVSFIFVLIIFLLMKQYDFRLYVILYVGTQAVAMIYSIIKGWDFIISKWSSINFTLRETFSNIKIGINLTFSNIASSLILGFGRGFVDSHWDINAFGVFSLSISLVNFILQFITQISMVMFPALRQVSSEKRSEIYILLRELLGITLCGVLILYVPMRIFFSWWLPDYSESMKYLSVILPICVFDGKMQMIYNTYLKVLRKERILLYINVLSCILSLLLCIALSLIYNVVIMAVLAMVIAIAIRSIISSIYLSKVMKIELEDNLIFELLLTATFIFYNVVLECWAAFIIYAITFGFVLYIKRNTLKKALFQVITKRKKILS